MDIARAFKIDKPMKFEISKGSEIVYVAYGDPGDWCLVLSNGRRVFVKE